MDLCIERMTANVDKDNNKGFPAIVSNVSLTEDKWSRKQHECLMTSNKDLAALLQGSAKCKKGKPPSTKETRKEAFDRYMKIIYRLPPNIKVQSSSSSSVDMDDIFNSAEHFVFPESCDNTSRILSMVTDIDVPVNTETKKEKSQIKVSGTNSKLKTLMKVKPWPVAIPKIPAIMEEDEEPPEISSPIERPKPKTPKPETPKPRTPKPETPKPRTPKPETPKPKTPAPVPPPCCQRTLTPLPKLETSTEVPTFLKQFADAAWFKDLYPDEKCIPSSLSAEDFSLELLGSLTTCGAEAKIKILTALQALYDQGLLENTDRLYQGLLDLMTKYVRPDMSLMETSALAGMFNLLMSLKPVGYDLMEKLLALLAFKKLSGLRETVLHMLTALGVNEAEQWLLPELESWDSKLQDPSDTWKSLQDKAHCWLELWAAEYQGHDRFLHRRKRTKWKPPTSTVLDVLNYFSCIQKDLYSKASCITPAGRKKIVLLPRHECSQPIFRLGETYSMARMSRPPCVILPPLRNRPFLKNFPCLISLPLPRITLQPFKVTTEEDWVKFSPRRYFIIQQSYVDYYR